MKGINSNILSLTTEVQNLLTPEQAWHYGIIPKKITDKDIIFYADQKIERAITQQELEVLFGKDIHFEIAPVEVLQRSLNKYYRPTKKQGKAISKITSDNTDDIVLKLISEAKELKSSDVHVEAYEDNCRIRFRIDGILIERHQISRDDYPAIINKIKIHANLDIAEKRLPQDGRINIGNMDVRVSVLPAKFGEKAVLRLLHKDDHLQDLDHLGFCKKDLNNYLKGIDNPNGIVLITGPTGSGKTTTLYATLKLQNKESRNILTIEDPIEYTLPGINQVQVKESIGLTFAGALRSFLSQDPDVIMLGEIRDEETAVMATRAALTGHQVLSTIHTNTAWGAISRLTDMGIPPFLIADSLNMVVAQRLVRLLCVKCKKEERMEPSFVPQKFKSVRAVIRNNVAIGCEECYYTGYNGRKAIYEVIPLDSHMKELIKNRETNIEHYLKEKGFKSLSENAFELYCEGESSLEELQPILANN